MKFFDGGLPRDVPVYIGIDQSYSGFSITALSGELYSTSVYTSQHRGIKRLADIKEYMITNLGRYQILDVAIEGYAFGSQMANMLGELGGMVKLSLFDMGIYPLIVPPTTLKKYVTGKGTGVPKSQMLLQVYKKWGAEFTDDNAADSYSLARVVSGQHALSYEKDVYDKLQDPKFRER